LIIALLAFQIYLNIAAYYAVMNGMKNFSLFVVGIIMLVFAGMFHLYRYGRSISRAPPIIPKPAIPPKPFPSPKAAPSISTPADTTARQLAPPPEVQKSASSPQSQGSSSPHSERATNADISKVGKNATQSSPTPSRDIVEPAATKTDTSERHTM
jgi:ubiquinol-cytochrome c reductase cytochrome b subunit